ncbi:hypothetical protein [Pseudomonas sp. MPC6]|jgi:hypothetical protein|uniref:hypothetical protein n=1 Tax=unclassified Pseudomonas TaxID=196821 RepID=UPI001110D984|nr:hypothetical protein [Pseudomonas sp. MPC6]QCY12947.1 hypothetical protein ELQ88_20405 [Pseudomonas sp. MPC6]
MHGYGMVEDLLRLALYLTTIAFWALFWMVCIFNAKDRLKSLLGAHALMIFILLFPVLPATFIGGALIAFGIEGLIWSLCITGIGLPIAGMQLVQRYAQNRC